LESIEDATTNLNRIQTAYFNATHRLNQSDLLEDEITSELDELTQFEMRFVEEMDDDFQAQNGITVVYDLVRFIKRYVDSRSVSRVTLTKGLALLEDLMAVFGIDLNVEAELLDADIEQLIEERETARKEKNFARADEIRDLLREENIVLEDTAQGIRWRRGNVDD